ncbi:MAG TPA: NosD domain-containing protein [Methanocella sp.]|nr:NosD domain-containing protein [Methanocella sp.]
MLAPPKFFTAAAAMALVALLALPPAALAASYSVPGNYTTITEAIANASAGDAVTVDSGTYHEHVAIDKGLTLLGRDTGSGRPEVDSIEITADNAIVQGFRIGGAAAGVDAHGCGNVKVLGCILVGAAYGIRLTGVHGGIVMNNTVTGSQNVGIYLSDSSGNSIYLNEVTGNQYGIALTGSSAANVVYMNTLKDNPGANGLGNGLFNNWNSSIPFTYGYGGRLFSRCLGNYWGDLRGADDDDDGVLDTSVMLAENNGDYDPLAEAPPDRPMANFTSDFTSGTAPLPVQFNDASRGYVVSWHWDFGDGAASDQQNPPHVYKNAGSYTVSLAVKNAQGEDKLIRSNYIVASGVPSPTPTPTPTPMATLTLTATPTIKPTGTATTAPTAKPTPGTGWLFAIFAVAAACVFRGRRGDQG